MTFSEFRQITRTKLKSGEIKISQPINDFDLLIMFAVSVIGEVKGYPHDTNTEEIYKVLVTLAKLDNSAEEILQKEGFYDII